MPLETIYVVRHGFRSGWTVDHKTGIYTSSIPTPTGIAADPALTSHGVDQAAELSTHLLSLPISAIFSSPYYRCLQTIEPYAAARKIPVRPEHGIAEWFGSAPFDHPQPAQPDVLKRMFPAYDEGYAPVLRPDVKGETVQQLYQRVGDTMRGVIQRCDKEGWKSVVLSTHAAVVIVLGRVLTGRIPDRVEEKDFHANTCGLSVFRREGEVAGGLKPGAVGGWTCELDSDCSFLSHGAERGWTFSGDESFPGTGAMSNEPKL